LEQKKFHFFFDLHSKGNFRQASSLVVSSSGGDVMPVSQDTPLA